MENRSYNKNCKEPAPRNCIDHKKHNRPKPIIKIIPNSNLSKKFRKFIVPHAIQFNFEQKFSFMQNKAIFRNLNYDCLCFNHLFSIFCFSDSYKNFMLHDLALYRRNLQAFHDYYHKFQQTLRIYESNLSK